MKMLKQQQHNQSSSNNLALPDSDDHLMAEQLVRNGQFFGVDNQKLIEGSYVLIFGIGGVGSHVLSAMIRSGVKKIGIVDFDRVTLSSLNRHAFATRRHVGLSKVEVFKQFANEINPNIELLVWETYVTENNVSDFFNGAKPDYVIDCIDNMDAKAALIAHCVNNEIKIIISCGAGMKSDPTRIQIRDISESTYDDLARALRHKLHRLRIKSGVKCVYCVEQTERELLPLKGHQVERVDEYRAFENYRLRIIPVFGCMPALIAYSISSYVLCELANSLYIPHNLEDVKQTTYNRSFVTLNNQAKKNKKEMLVDLEDIYIVSREIYQSTCLVKNNRNLSLHIVHWDISRDVTIDNIALMNEAASKKHMACTSFEEVKKLYNADVFERKLKLDQKLDAYMQRRPRTFR